MSKGRGLLLAVLCLLVLLLASCAGHRPAGSAGDPGFWMGLWHGIIAPFTFIISLFSDIRMYAFPNIGRWYDFGFLMGVSIWGGGGAAARKRR